MCEAGPDESKTLSKKFLLSRTKLTIHSVLLEMEWRPWASSKQFHQQMDKRAAGDVDVIIDMLNVEMSSKSCYPTHFV